MTEPATSDGMSDTAFARELTALIPHMRAFARSLTSDVAEADDLAQDALTSAWKNRGGFALGTNMKAWTFMILRNQFYSQRRRSWRSSPLDPEVAESSLVANDSPGAPLELEELRQAMNALAPDQREALILVGAGGLSYEEAAEICGCAVGTIKSRVSRARKALVSIIETGAFARIHAPAAAASATILSELERLQRNR